MIYYAFSYIHKYDVNCSAVVNNHQQNRLGLSDRNKQDVQNGQILLGCYKYESVIQALLNMRKENKKQSSQQVLKKRQTLNNTSNTTNANDVSFSIPDWKQQQIKSINEQYQKEIYTAVQLSLTDFDSREEVQFLSSPQKSTDQRYAYERKLIHSEDFCILAFILCFEQLLIGDSSQQEQKLEKFKKKINELNLCKVSNIPHKMANYYDDKILKKILFQYINKGSYNVSLLEVLLRRNSVLKFSLSLVSKSILKMRGLIDSYQERIPFEVEMRNCGDQFGVLSTIKVRAKYIETQNFRIQFTAGDVKILRKQNIIRKTEQLNYERSLTPNFKSQQSQLISKKSIRSSKEIQKKQSAQLKQKKLDQKGRSSSLVNFLRKIICF